MSEPNIICTGARVITATIDRDSGVISGVSTHPQGIPRFIEIGFKDGNVLEVYADGTHSDNEEFRFVKYQAPSNYSARKWLFERFFQDDCAWLWKAYLLLRRYRRWRLQWLAWYLNKTEKCPHTFHGWTRDDVSKRWPSLRLRRWRPKRQSCFCKCCCGKNQTAEEIHRICEENLNDIT